MKKFIVYLTIMLSLSLLQGAKFIINPTTNAVSHNEKGVRFLEDGYYAAAINEFKIAIGLNHESAASATFYNNLGLTYMRLRDYNSAITSFYHFWNDCLC